MFPTPFRHLSRQTMWMQGEQSGQAPPSLESTTHNAICTLFNQIAQLSSNNINRNVAMHLMPAHTPVTSVSKYTQKPANCVKKPEKNGRICHVQKCTSKRKRSQVTEHPEILHP